jgi:hypothetical protein
MKLLGISSRINHPQFGKGVITNVSSTEYWVTFIDSGLERHCQLLRSRTKLALHP